MIDDKTVLAEIPCVLEPKDCMIQLCDIGGTLMLSCIDYSSIAVVQLDKEGATKLFEALRKEIEQ